jgi:hypothetical protein
MTGLLSLLHLTSSFRFKTCRYCWIVSKSGHDMIGVLMQILVLYGPMWTCILFDLVAYGLIWRKQQLMVFTDTRPPLSLLTEVFRFLI